MKYSNQNVFLTKIKTKEDALKAIASASVVLYLLAILSFVGYIAGVGDVYSPIAYVVFGVFLQKTHSRVIAIILAIVLFASFALRTYAETVGLVSPGGFFSYMVSFSNILVAFWATRGTWVLGRVNKAEQAVSIPSS